MLNSITLILCCQLAGELVSKFLNLPAPGPVIGMVLLFILLLAKGGISKPLAACADGLLNHLSLLFVPAGVGVMLHFRLLGQDWLAVSAALVVSTLLTIAITALMMNWLGRSEPDAKSAQGEGRKRGRSNG